MDNQKWRTYIHLKRKWVLGFFIAIVFGLFCHIGTLYFQAQVKIQKEHQTLLNYFSKFYELDEVREIRKTFNLVLVNDYTNFQNASEFKSYFSSPLKVIDSRNHPFGGKTLRIYFIRDFDHFFDVWLYKVDEDAYTLRSIEKVKMPEEKFQKVRKKLRFYTRNKALQI